MNNSLRVGVGTLALAAAVLAHPVRAAEVEKLLPADTTMVLSLNVKQLLASPLVEKYAKDQLQQALKDGDAQQILKEIGLDPMTDFHRLTVAFTAEHGPDKPLLVVRGKFDPKKIAAKAAQYAKDHPDKLKVVKAGDATLYEIAGKGPNQTMYAVVVDDSTVVAGNVKQMVTDAVAQAKGGKKATPSKELTELIGAANDKQSLWLVVLPKTFEKLPVPNPDFKKFVEQLSALTGSADVSSDVKVEVGLVAKDADAAKTLAGQVEQGLDQAKSLLPVFLANNDELKPVIELVNSLKSSTSGKTVLIKGSLSQKYLDEQLKKKTP